MDRINELTCQYKIPLVLFLVGIVLIIGGLFSTRPHKTDYPKESLVKGVTASIFKVDVAGAINVPGVYTFKTGDRVEDAIKAAGGFSAASDPDYISKKLNLSLKLSDGMKIYIPKQGESGPEIVGSRKIGINSASAGELEKLPGIGAVGASKIISKRPYGTIDELLTKKAVSKAVFEKIKELVNTN